MAIKRDLKKIITLFISIFVIILLLFGLASTSKVTETINAKEYHQYANYGTIRYFFESFSEIELSYDESQYVIETIFELINEINEKADEDTGFAIYDNKANILLTSDESDSLLNELIISLNDDEHKITNNYSYRNYVIGNYRFLLRINHDGISNIIFDEAFKSNLLFYCIAFVLSAIIIFALFYFIHNNKIRKIIGLLAIIIWIGSISYSATQDLKVLQKNIIEDETKQLTSLISYYYKQDIIDQDTVIEDYKAWAEQMIYQFTISNDYIENISLNEKYDINDLDISDCLTFTYNNKAINNKTLEFYISYFLLLILAILIYGRLINDIYSNEDFKQENLLDKFDNQFLKISLICIIGSSLTWSIILPRLLEIAEGYGNAHIAIIYAAGIGIGTIVSMSSSYIYAVIKSMKHYCLLVYIFEFIGLLLLGFSDNFIIACLAYFLTYFYNGLVSVIPYFYSSSMDEKHKNEFLIQANNNAYIGQSIGLIIGGVLGSIISYSGVLLIAAVILFFSIIILLTTRNNQYNYVQSNNVTSLSLPAILNKKHSFLYLLLIITPLAFYSTYTDYQFPIEILSLGLTTVVISFISTLSRLISAYSSKFFYHQLNKKTNRTGMTYIYVLGSIGIMFFNSLKTSLLFIVIVSLAFGILGSFGILVSRERAIEITNKENINENDANVCYNLANKFGSTIGPSIITIFGNSICLPIVALIAFVIYFLFEKHNKQLI